MVMKEEMLMEEKLVINELEQGKELATRLMNNLKNPSSSSEESNKSLISEIIRSCENAISMLNLDMKSRKRSHERINQSNKKRRISEKKKTDKIKICVGAGQEGTSLDDGYCWRKYGQKDIHGSKNPRGYYRCTHRFTKGCLAVKQVQKSDTNPLCYEIKYLESHTCNIIPLTNKYAVFVSEEELNKGPKLYVTDQSKDTIKHMKSEEMILSLEDLDNKKEIFRTFSFSNPETENFFEWKDSTENMSPTKSDSGITYELLSEFANSPIDDSCFSSLENIFNLSHDWSHMCNKQL
ncbi:hypothetical protein AALP_AAs51301U000100 [Arabis alpina]|uniref:WRKY domain-containing protein n=1 Tax=Arabis alpina TaxID=50452 RepID=A0A087FXS2_ARAAL|nr:hypothetical protein AALP_AAs51301U000100 [Arabis alpina]